jgi:hypothetical protein
MDTYEDRLRVKLGPEAVRRALVRAGCLLSAYELIKSEVVKKVHDFYWCGFEDGHHLYDEVKYRQHVLSRDSNRFKASCSWLVEMGALTAAQVVVLEEIHQHRNQVAHELPKLLIDPEFEVRADLLEAAIECVRKLGVFWGTIEVQVDPYWHDKEVDFDGIKSMSFLLMEYLASIAELSTPPSDAGAAAP